MFGKWPFLYSIYLWMATIIIKFTYVDWCVLYFSLYVYFHCLFFFFSLKLWAFQVKKKLCVFFLFVCSRRIANAYMCSNEWNNSVANFKELSHQLYRSLCMNIWKKRKNWFWNVCVCVYLLDILHAVAHMCVGYVHRFK